jgi:hypothetical protein
MTNMSGEKARTLQVDKLTAENKTIWMDDTKGLLIEAGVFYMADPNVNDAQADAKAIKNLKRKDKIKTQGLEKKELQELVDERQEIDEQQARNIIKKRLRDSDKLELLSKNAEAMWKYCLEIGKDTKEDTAEHLERDFLKIRRTGQPTMHDYLVSKREAWQKIQATLKDYITEEKMFRHTLEHLGRLKKPQQKLREVYIECKTLLRSKKLTWDVLVAKLELAEQDEETDGDESDGSDDDEANTTTSKGLKAENKRLTEQLAFFTEQKAQQRPRRETRTCFNCGKQGHIAAKCWIKNQQESNDRGRFQQGRGGFGGRGGGNGGRRGGRGNFDRRLWDSAHFSVTLEDLPDEECLFTGDGERSQVWICTDGASTTHVANTKEQFSAMKNVRQTQEVMLMNRHPCKILARGDLTVSCQGTELTLKNVAYVPASKHCLLSVSKLLDYYPEGSVQHTKDSMVIDLASQGRVFGERKGGLYFFPGTIKIVETASLTKTGFFDTTGADDSDDYAEDCNINESIFASSSNKLKTSNYYHCLLNDPTTTGDSQRTVTASAEENKQDKATKVEMKEWAKKFAVELHQRLGHVGLRALHDSVSQNKGKLQLKNKEAAAIKSLKPGEVICDPCELAKSRRKHPSKEKSQRTANKHHRTKDTATTPEPHVNQMTVDTAGPNDPGRAGARYAHVAVLDKHAYSEVGFSRRKGEASDFIRTNYPLWKDAIDKPRTLKTDRGGEYRSHSFERWCKKRGIHHKLTAPNCSSGSAEKKIDTLQNLSKAMMNDANAPRSLWPEAFQYANTVTLIVPSASKKMGGLSPWESRWKERPPLEKLHRWGCVAYVNVPKSKRRRQHNKGRKGMFLGLCENRNDGWRFYDKDLNSIFTGRSATFNDSELYYKRKDGSKSTVVAEKRVHFEGEDDDNNEAEQLIDRRPSCLPDKTALEERRAGTEPRRRAQTSFFDLHLYDRAAEHDNKDSQGRAMQTNTNSIGQTLAKWNYQKHRGYTQGLSLQSGKVPEGPDAFKIACTGEDRALWLDAIKKEMTSMRERQVFRKAHRKDIPSNQRPIKGKWVFDIKRKADGSVERYKARLVAKGFQQRYGVDYLETFSPTPSFSAVRLLAAMALQHGWTIDHLDVKTAFLYGELEEWEKIFMVPPEGYSASDNEIFRLNKCLYGLKQSARKWFKKITKILKKAGMQPSTADPCVFVAYNKSGDLEAAMAVHVDDILVTGTDKMVAKVKKILSNEFEIKDLGKLSWYLGVRFTWTKDELYMTQEKYTAGLLEKHRMEHCNRRLTPADKNKLRKPREEITEQEQEKLVSTGKTQTAFRSVVGEARYLADRTRPDIAYAVGQLAKHMHDPRSEHWVATKQLLAYLKGTPDFGLRFRRVGSRGPESKIVGWSDSDWAQDPDNRSSTSGYVFMYAGGAVSWGSKKQPIIARSTAEAELVALDLAAREGKWLRKLRRDFCLGNDPTILKEDNEAAIAISEKHQRTPRTKHIDVQYFAICEDVRRGDFRIEPVASAENVSDTFTKGLGRVKFAEFREAMGVVALPAEGER